MHVPITVPPAGRQVVILTISITRTDRITRAPVGPLATRLTPIARGLRSCGVLTATTHRHAVVAGTAATIITTTAAQAAVLPLIAAAPTPRETPTTRRHAVVGQVAADTPTAMLARAIASHSNVRISLLSSRRTNSHLTRVRVKARAVVSANPASAHPPRVGLAVAAAEVAVVAQWEGAEAAVHASPNLI